MRLAGRDGRFDEKASKKFFFEKKNQKTFITLRGGAGTGKGMNYRHAFHAGNFADCVKHALLVEILLAMLRKDKPFLVLDTHAGIGRYDLQTIEAEKTGEWREGILRVLVARPAALKTYCGLVERLGLYPGSPAIAAAMLRETDRLVACELHPEDARALKAAFAGVKNVAVHERDGFAAPKAFLPPVEKRAVVLIDPPYEREDEFEVLVKTLAAAWERFRQGVYVAWYPVKHRAPVRAFFAALKLSGMRDVVVAEFWRRPPENPKTMNGCGLVVVNPPYGFEPRALEILQALTAVLGEAGAGCAVERLADE
jgi:23S rRNA (adenine2030-N6)-methyltransferase